MYQWISWLLLGCTALIVWARAEDNKKLKLLLRAGITNSNLEQLIRSEFKITNRLSIKLFFIFLVSASLFLMQSNRDLNIFEQSVEYVFFIKTAGLILGFYLLKLFFVRITGFIFERQQEAFTHNFNIVLFCNILGLILFPVTILIEFLPIRELKWVFTSIYLVIGLLYAFKLLRFISLGFEGNYISRVYFFLYLCTLEILPFVVVLKLLMSRF